MNSLSWQQKAAALNALAEIQIKTRPDGSWYVRQGVEVKRRGVLIGAYGNGDTPQEAINDHWQQLVGDLTTEQYLVVGAYGEKRLAVRWNGFMWARVEEQNNHD